MISGVTITSTGAQLTNSSILYTLDTVIILSYFLAGGYLLIRKKKNLELIQRQQINFVLFGIAFAFFVNFVTNYILAFFKIKNSSNLLGPLSLFIFVSITAYSIVKHRLFDIRLVVAKAVGYLFSLGAVVGIYSGLVFGLIANFVDPARAGIMQQFVYVALAVVTALFFPPIKKFFDKWSNKLFYQDAYEPQDLLNELNNLLVSQIELDKILKNGAEIIQKYL